MDTWYATKDVMLQIEKFGKIYHCPLKDNRQVDDSGGEKPYQRVDSLTWSESEKPQVGWSAPLALLITHRTNFMSIDAFAMESKKDDHFCGRLSFVGAERFERSTSRTRTVRSSRAEPRPEITLPSLVRTAAIL